MKRLQPPSGLRPDLAEAEIEKTNLPLPVQPVPKLSSLPAYSTSDKPALAPGSIYGHNLKRLKSYNKIRRSQKINIQKSVFMNDLELILAQFPPSDHMYDDELLITYLNICESYFCYNSKEERTAAKQEAYELMLPYFQDDSKLLEKSISHVWKKVNKSNLCKRLWSRVKFFLLKKVPSLI